MMDVDFYNHLKKDYKTNFDMDEKAGQIIKMNYGCRNMLAAILKAREKDIKENPDSYHCKIQTQKLRDLLEGGFC